MGAMPATHALIELLGAVALLLWGVHMVRTGILRAFGGALRQLLGRTLRNRLAACLAGASVTLALQKQYSHGDDGDVVPGGRRDRADAGAGRDAGSQCRHGARRLDA